MSVVETVDGKSGTNDISAMRKDHFQKSLNSVPSSSLHWSLYDYYFERFTHALLSMMSVYIKHRVNAYMPPLVRRQLLQSQI